MSKRDRGADALEGGAKQAKVDDAQAAPLAPKEEKTPSVKAESTPRAGAARGRTPGELPEALGRACSDALISCWAKLPAQQAEALRGLPVDGAMLEWVDEAMSTVLQDLYDSQATRPAADHGMAPTPEGKHATPSPDKRERPTVRAAARRAERAEREAATKLHGYVIWLTLAHWPL
ncbi:hypothetical protein M885DRAFT_556615 [Pelagophyceae sp. CCMP2097]|nr:hypothetical protein M885DRAFT_556615 [Pelagophyceae sp. CCMP2097]